jgi:hypothetical protein
LGHNGISLVTPEIHQTDCFALPECGCPANSWLADAVTTDFKQASPWWFYSFAYLHDSWEYTAEEHSVIAASAGFDSTGDSIWA